MGTEKPNALGDIPMKMTRAEYESHQDENSGYCTQCEMITTSEIEPDAQGYECPECGNESVMGIENALIYENIEITDDEEKLDDTEIINLSDLDEDDL